MIRDDKRRLTKEFRAETKMFAECVLHDNSQERVTILALLDDIDAADEEIARLTSSREMWYNIAKRRIIALGESQKENERLRAALPDADNLDAIADFLDKMFPLDPDSEVQRDLRRWASLIRECGGEND